MCISILDEELNNKIQSVNLIYVFFFFFFFFWHFPDIEEINDNEIGKTEIGVLDLKSKAKNNVLNQ